MKKITMNITKQIKKEGTKTVWIDDTKKSSVISEENYNNCTSDDTVKWFRRLGGSETVTRNYTKLGYLVTKLVSTSPDKQQRTIREFEFEDISNYLQWDLYKEFKETIANDIFDTIVRQSENREINIMNTYSHLIIDGNIMSVVSMDNDSFNVDLRPDSIGGLC